MSLPVFDLASRPRPHFYHVSTLALLTPHPTHPKSGRAGQDAENLGSPLSTRTPRLYSSPAYLRWVQMSDTLGRLSLIIHTYLYCTRLEAWPCRKCCPPLPDLLSLYHTRETNYRLFTQPSSGAPQTSSPFSSIYGHPFSCCGGYWLCVA